MRFVTATVLSSFFLAAIAAAQAPTAPTPGTEPAPAATGSVARAQFTSAVQDREPVDRLTALEGGKTQVYFYSELKNFAGARLMHRWEYQGKVMHEQPFDVGGARWRVWSNKTLDPSWTGEWKVSVVDGTGATLAVQTLTVGATPPAPPAAPTELKKY